MTNKEISQRLKDVGFDVPSMYEHRLISMYDADSKWMTTRRTDEHTVIVLEIGEPAYDAETLFKWLREQGTHGQGLDVIFLDELYVDEHRIDFKTSLADMLGEAIIWIKEQENE